MNSKEIENETPLFVPMGMTNTEKTQKPQKFKICRRLKGNLIDYMNTIFILCVLVEVSIIVIIGLVYADDLNQLLYDAKQNMDDLNIILPEVKESLRIIKVICKAPQYAPYCYST